LLLSGDFPFPDRMISIKKGEPYETVRLLQSMVL